MLGVDEAGRGIQQTGRISTCEKHTHLVCLSKWRQKTAKEWNFNYLNPRGVVNGHPKGLLMDTLSVVLVVVSMLSQSEVELPRLDQPSVVNREPIGLTSPVGGQTDRQNRSTPKIGSAPQNGTAVLPDAAVHGQ